ncbi:hypothetical protein BJX70DRAFT_401285 [Aspergillus crustosus]
MPDKRKNRKRRAKNKSDPKEAPPAVETPALDPSITEYNQPDSSPYQCETATIFIGPSSNRYTIPANIINQVPALQLRRSQSTSGPITVMLPEVDEDIGHTLIHYLHTGDYETLRQSSGTDVPRRTTEYRRSLLAYQASWSCSLTGLAEHAKKYMGIFDKEIPISDVVALGREVFPRVYGDPWYSEYLTEKVLASFEADNAILEHEEFFKGFVGFWGARFEIFLAKVMVKAYTRRLNSLRDSISDAVGALHEQYSRTKPVWSSCKLVDYQVEDSSDSTSTGERLWMPSSSTDSAIAQECTRD